MSFAFNIPFRVERYVSHKTTYVKTKGLSDSFWATNIVDLGVQVNLPSPAQFGFEVDMEFPGEDFHSPNDYGTFGFCKANGFFAANMESYRGEEDVYAYTLGSVITSATTTRLLVSSDSRHVIRFGFDPSSMYSIVSVDGESTSRTLSSAPFPYDTNFSFGGYAGNKDVTSVTRAVKMLVYGIKIWQFDNLVADLVPYNDGPDVGMMDKLNGSKFPGSNIEYGEE